MRQCGLNSTLHILFKDINYEKVLKKVLLTSPFPYSHRILKNMITVGEGGGGCESISTAFIIQSFQNICLSDCTYLLPL